jgi:hypothetical protein
MFVVSAQPGDVVAGDGRILPVIAFTMLWMVGLALCLTYTGRRYDAGS